MTSIRPQNVITFSVGESEKNANLNIVQSFLPERGHIDFLTDKAEWVAVTYIAVYKQVSVTNFTDFQNQYCNHFFFGHLISYFHLDILVVIFI